MAGLLDFATDPQSAMLTQMAFGLLNAGGPQSRPVSLGQAIGQAGQEGMQGYQQAQQNQMIQMKMDELKKRNAFMQNMNLQSPTLAQDALGSGALDLKDYLAMQIKQKPELVEVEDPLNPGRTVKKWVMPGNSEGTSIGYSPLKAPEGMQYANGQLTGIPGYVDMKKQIAAAGRQAPNATPYFQFLPTADGYVAGNARTGQVAPLSIGGKPVVRATDSPLLQGQIAGEKAQGSTYGKAKATASAEQKQAESSFPQLEKTVKQLSDIGKEATYTYAGQARDAVVRQLGMGATNGAVAREKYIQTVRDVLFPQLRATFGAQFTVKEGEALIATMGDPNKSPEEKDAALNAFIDQKKQYIESLRKNKVLLNGGREAPLPSAVFDEADAILRGEQ